jgi:hypothetical protein
MTLQDPIEQDQFSRVGCAWAMLVINVVVIGLLTASMVQGPYSSREQELWYRYGSIGFFIAGVILPTVMLFTIRRSRSVLSFATVWMFASLVGFMWFVAMSSGGV